MTHSGGLVYADDVVLFDARRLPPTGMENNFATALRLPPEQLVRLHILPQSQIDTWLAIGHFHTVTISTIDPRVQALGLLRRYAARSSFITTTSSPTPSPSPTGPDFAGRAPGDMRQ